MVHDVLPKNFSIKSLPFVMDSYILLSADKKECITLYNIPDTLI